MGTRANTINLATVRVIEGNVPKSGKFSIQLNSTNLSASTTFRLQYTLDDTVWVTAQEAGTDVTDSLVANTPKLKSFEADPSIASWRISFDGATTGTVSYRVNGI